jgi:exopolysaccharide biosynthesis predicted pyruvyltransferase EpsI
LDLTVTNNLAESFNNWVKDWKDLPIVEFADKIREMIMTLFHKRRAISKRLHGRILPAVLQ